MHRYRHALRSVLVFSLFLLLGLPAYASHYAAADINVQYIGPKPGVCTDAQTNFTYRVTITIYKACEQGSIDLDQSISYSISSPSGCSPTINRNISTPEVDTLDQLCGTYKSINSCRMPQQGGPGQYPYPGFIRHTFTDIVTLPKACADWTFAWTSGARNAGILNLAGAGGQSIYIACLLNNVIDPFNSSPKFTSDPLPFLCVGRPSIYLNGPQDVDGDALRVEASNPQGASAANLLTYNAGYTYQNPVNSPPSDPYTVNPLTGTTTFQVTTQGKYVLSFRAYEYDKNGALKGYIDRDVQVSVLPCTNPTPQIDTLPVNVVSGNIIPTLNGNIVTVCPGNQLQFNVGSTSAGGSILTLSANNREIIPTSNFTVTGQGTSTVNGTFSWTPQLGDEGDYTIIFSTSDSTCSAGQSILQKNYLSVLIRVPRGVEIDGQDYYCTSRPQNPVMLRAGSPDSMVQYTWSVLPGGDDASSISCINCSATEVRPKKTTSYVATAAFSPLVCKNSDTFTVYTNNIEVNPSREIILCRPGAIQLDASPTGPKPIYKLSCGQGQASTCQNGTDTATIGSCDVSSSRFSPFNTTDRSSRVQMLYLADEMKIRNLRSGTLRRVGFYIDTVAALSVEDLRISVTCTPKTVLNGASDFVSNASLVYQAAAPTVLTQGWNYFDLQTPYNWDTTQNLLIDICAANTSGSAALSSAIRYTSTNTNSVLKLAGNVSLCGPDYTRFSMATTSRNRPNLFLSLCPPDDSTYNVLWSPGTYMQDSTVSNPYVYIPRDMHYDVILVGRDSCLVRDGVDIKVVQDTLYVTPVDSLICPGDVAILQASSRESVRWFQGNGFDTPTTLDCATCPRVIARPTEDTKYYVVGYNTYGNSNRVTCADTAVATVRLKERANVEITPKMQTIRYGEQATLNARGAISYVWTPGGGSINTNAGPVIVAKPLVTTIYTVTGVGENGCADSDTATVKVDATTAVFVPSAFSPNGDGHNDYFNVMNLTTQRVTEFRIFNRWGVEVFNNNSSANGWDGTYKGTAQPTGSYTYLIRINTPDGKSEVLKGDITLIR